MWFLSFVFVYMCCYFCYFQCWWVYVSLLCYLSYCIFNVLLSSTLALTLLSLIYTVLSEHMSSPLLSWHQSVLLPTYPAKSCYHNRLLCSTFTLHWLGLCIPAYWLYFVCLLWGAGQVLFSPFNICFALVCVKSHRIFVAVQCCICIYQLMQSAAYLGNILSGWRYFSCVVFLWW